MKTLFALLFCFFAWSAIAQERFIPSVGGMETVPDYLNASSLDGQFAILPSSTPTSGEYILYFDLGYMLPAKTPLPVNIYGDIPSGSNLFLGAIYDEPLEGFAHRVVTTTVVRHGDNSQVAFALPQWDFPVRHLCLIRVCSTTSSQVNKDGSVTPGVTDKENGLDCRIDAVSVGQKKQNTARNWQTSYGCFIINNSLSGKSLEGKAR